MIDSAVLLSSLGLSLTEGMIKKGIAREKERRTKAEHINHKGRLKGVVY
jgi:hypothetical protein